MKRGHLCELNSGSCHPSEVEELRGCNATIVHCDRARWSELQSATSSPGHTVVNVTYVEGELRQVGNGSRDSDNESLAVLVDHVDGANSAVQNHTVVHNVSLSGDNSVRVLSPSASVDSVYTSVPLRVNVTDLTLMPAGSIPTTSVPTTALPTTSIPTTASPTTSIPTPHTPHHTTPSPQQHLLNQWLDAFCQRQSLQSPRTPTVYYDVYKFAGLGNVFRGFFSAMAIAALTNRAIQGRSFVSSPL